MVVAEVDEVSGAVGAAVSLADAVVLVSVVLSISDVAFEEEVVELSPSMFTFEVIPTGRISSNLTKPDVQPTEALYSASSLQ